MSNKIKLNEMFECLKGKTTNELTQEEKEENILNFIEWNRPWMGFCDYDLTEKHIYHFENVCLAVDQITSATDEYFKITDLTVP